MGINCVKQAIWALLTPHSEAVVSKKDL
ncbi:unnamed protein product [Acanthoscelides obtectus]|uniref:Uncharacterized protein n=1 Tax=Acanthoscelides obtectus TaxID=200917 RepID=A0A9P0LMZ8_ACAOB|nr:unnamed protein product [Acanthoscelides obtectus]CAK1686127.1 hypothetical protein AOBTE_LOCUS35802 [Acanthoscelides obtectus]